MISRNKYFLSVLILFTAMILISCGNVKEFEDFNSINKGMSTEKVLGLLGKPAEKTTDLSVIQTELIESRARYKELFDEYDEYVDELEATGQNKKGVRRYRNHKKNYEDAGITLEYIKERANLEMYTYNYKEPDEEDLIYLYRIIFRDNKIEYLHTYNYD